MCIGPSFVRPRPGRGPHGFRIFGRPFCLGLNSPFQIWNCWDPFTDLSHPYAFHNFVESVIIFYIVTILAASGTVMLVGPMLQGYWVGCGDLGQMP
jgi:hypothetical protein